MSDHSSLERCVIPIRSNSSNIYRKTTHNLYDQHSREPTPVIVFKNDEVFGQRKSVGSYLRKASAFFFRGGYLLFLWIWLQIALISYSVWLYGFSQTYSKMYAILGVTLPIARGAAQALTLDMGIIMLFVSLRFLTFFSRFPALRKILDLNNHKRSHIFIGCTILFFTLVHVVAHVFNHIKLAKATNDNFFRIFFTTKTGITGFIALLCFILMGYTARPAFRKIHFNWFIGVHHLYIVAFACLMFHADCIIKRDIEPVCGNGPMFWKMTLPPLIIFAVDKILGYISLLRTTKILKVIEKPSNVVEVRFLKSALKASNGNYNYKAGQYIYVSVPEVSLFERHPITVTSAPEDDYVSFNMSAVGDWTKKVKEVMLREGFEKQGLLPGRFGARKEFPTLRIEGPFLAPSDEAHNYDNLLLVASGIGVTPFISILKSFAHRARSGRIKGKVYFVWIAPKPDSFEWFYDLLAEIEEIDNHRVIEMMLFWTVKRVTPSFCHKVSHSDLESGIDPITKLRFARTWFGRPRWEQLFDRIDRKHPGRTIGTFFCGAKPLGDTLANICEKRGSRYEFHREIF